MAIFPPINRSSPTYSHTYPDYMGFESASRHKNFRKLFRGSICDSRRIFLPPSFFQHITWKSMNMLNWCETETHFKTSIGNEQNIDGSAANALVMVTCTLITWFLDCGIYNYFTVNQILLHAKPQANINAILQDILFQMDFQYNYNLVCNRIIASHRFEQSNIVDIFFLLNNQLTMMRNILTHSFANRVSW